MGSQHNMGKINFNTLFFGTFTGITIPVLFFILIYFVKESDMGLMDFIREFYQIKALPKLISLCLLPDLIVFFAFMRKDFFKGGRGVILSLFIYAVVILVLKFG